MRSRTLALTGPAGAARWGLDGYRGIDWPQRFCTPAAGRAAPDVIRTRHWLAPVEIDGVLVAPVPLVLRHLDGVGACGSLSAADRVELALEHALRDGLVQLGDLVHRGPYTPGTSLLAEVLRRRPPEPPTGSYTETIAVQRFRRWQLGVWRQVPILLWSRPVYRADFMVPYRPTRRRPASFPPGSGLLIEIDGEAYHDFEADHRRNSTYDRLGHHWISVSARQVQHRPEEVKAAIAGALHRARTFRPRTNLPQPS